VLLDLFLVTPEAKGAVPDEKEGDRFVLSRRASDQLKPSPPPAGPPTLLPCLTSLKACAPKLTLLAKDGENGGPVGAVESPSSKTAGSSPKLLRNSGEPDAEEVETLARRCFAKAVNGDPDVGLFPPKPNVEIDSPRRG